MMAKQSSGSPPSVPIAGSVSIMMRMGLSLRQVEDE